MTNEYAALKQREIDRITKLHAAGVKLTNITEGGESVYGVVMLYDRATGEYRYQSKYEPIPERFCWPHGVPTYVTFEMPHAFDTPMPTE